MTYQPPSYNVHGRAYQIAQNYKYEILCSRGVTMKITVCWDVAPCSLVREERAAFILYKTTRRNIPGGSNIQI
jgi:hypothetical protein